MGLKPLKIGNAQGFWGDSPSAPARLVQQQPDLDILTLDYLSEVSLSIMAIQQKNLSLGYARDFIHVIASLIPLWKNGSKVKVIANAGGLNPRACAQACQEVLKNGNLSKKIGLVEGDDALHFLKDDPDNILFHHLETHEPLRLILDDLVTANAYLGASPIAQALALNADIVITGRVADPSLTVGPCMHYFGWKEFDFNAIAGATVAGHLIECGTQATGGISTHWLSLRDQANIGFPIVEVSADGTCILTKPDGTSGEVSIRNTKEQLLYELGDPAHYLSPDATVSFLDLNLSDSGINRVGIKGAKGSTPPPNYKVSATYRAGFRADAFLAIVGPEAIEKGRVSAAVVQERVRLAGFELEHFHFDCIGEGAIAKGVLKMPENPPECLLRISVSDPRQEAIECFTKEIAPLVTSGPQGTTGYISGRPKVRPVFGYWPCLIPREKIKVSVCLYN